MLRAASPDALEVSRIIEDESTVVLHGRAGSTIFFAVYRFEDGRASNHWHFAAPVAPPNKSGHSQTDGPAKPNPDQDSGEAKALVREYFTKVHIAGDHAKIDDYMSDDLQIRHEPNVRDGVTAATLTRTRTIDEIMLLIGQNDMVFVAARGTHEGEPCAYLDLYRVAGGKLVEHWGFPQASSDGDEFDHDRV